MKRAKLAILIAACCGSFGCGQEGDLSIGSDTETSQSELFVDETGVVPASTVRYVCFDPGLGGPITSYTDSTKCVDVRWGSNANYTPVQLYACNNSDAQKWTLATDGTIRALGKCLDINNNQDVPGTVVQLFDCNGTDAQKWDPREAGAGHSFLVKRNTNLCLDLPNNIPADTVQLQIYYCNDSDAQRWKVPTAQIPPGNQRQARDALTNSWPAVTQVNFAYWGLCPSPSPSQDYTTEIYLQKGRFGSGTFGISPGTHRSGISLDMPPLGTSEDWSRGTIVHEFGHVLSFAHEQGRTDNQPGGQYPNGPYCQQFQGSWEDEAAHLTGVAKGVFDPESVDNYCQLPEQMWMLSRNDILGSQAYYGSRAFRRSLWTSNTAIQSNHKPSSGADTLSVGAKWSSVDGVVALTLQQTDGQLAVIRTDLPPNPPQPPPPGVPALTAFAPLWLSGTTVTNPVASFGTDGILRVVDGSKKTRWQSTTTSYKGATLSIQHDGNVVITDTSGKVRWQTNTAHRSDFDGAVGLIPSATLVAGASVFTKSGRFELRMQTDGNLVLYDQANHNDKKVWASNTNTKSPKPVMARMMVDVKYGGRLALLSAPDTIVWAAPYTGAPGTFLAVQEDGRLVAYEPTKYEVWKGGTGFGHGQVGDFNPVYSSDFVALWNGSTLQAGQIVRSPSGKAELEMQTDGNLVLYVNTAASGQPPYWTATWASDTWNTDADHATIEYNGALRVYSRSTGAALYDSDTSGYMNTYLSFNDSGVIRIYRVVTVGADSVGFSF